MRELKREFLRGLGASNYSPRSIKTYDFQLQSFEAWAAERGVSDPKDMTPAFLRAYVQSLWDEGRYAVGTLCLKVRALKRFFEYMTKTGYLTTNPSQLLKEPKQDKTLPRQTLNVESVARLMETVNTNTPVGLRNMAYLETLASCGLRHREIQLLEVGDIDLVSGMLMVREGKGGKPRLCPLTPQAIHWLGVYLDKGRPRLSGSQSMTGDQVLTESLWLGLGGRPLQKQMLRNIVKEYSKKAGLKDIQVHDFRRYMLTECVRNGMPLLSAAKIAGHSSTETLRRYCAVSGLDLKEVIKSHPRERDARRDDEDEPPVMSGRKLPRMKP
jgi:integrase/recombinase XerD